MLVGAHGIGKVLAGEQFCYRARCKSGLPVQPVEHAEIGDVFGLVVISAKQASYHSIGLVSGGAEMSQPVRIEAVDGSAFSKSSVIPSAAPSDMICSIRASAASSCYCQIISAALVPGIVPNSDKGLKLR